MSEQEQWSLLISSHDVEEVQRLADRVVLLENGQVLLEESMEDLLARHRQVEVVLPDGAVQPAIHPPSWHGMQQQGRILRFVETCYTEELLASALGLYLPKAISHSVIPLTLREIFVSQIKSGENNIQFTAP